MAFQFTIISAKSHRQSRPCKRVAPETSRNSPYSVQPSTSIMLLEPQNEGRMVCSCSSYSISARYRVTGMEKKLVTVRENSSV